MSLQDGTDDVNKVGALAQEMIDSSDHGEDTKIYIHCTDGHWYVTRDHK